MSSCISVGVTAPDFTLKDNRGDMVNLSDYRGKTVLLSWHPLAWTRVCAEQMTALEANFDLFAEFNVLPLGLSVDPYPSKNAWAKELKIAKLKLLSDFWPHGSVANAYGLFREEDGFSDRANIILNQQGKVVWTKVYGVHDLPDLAELMAVLKIR